MSYPDEEKHADFEEVFFGIVGAIWFIAVVAVTSISIISIVC